MNIEPDGLTGALLAVESITDARAVLNGPLGCKYYHGFLADYQYPRPRAASFHDRQEKYYFGQPRIPCSYLDEDDYIAGAKDKLENLLPTISKKRDGLVVIVNSPGAALIGDDIEGAIREFGDPARMIALEEPVFSVPASTTYDGTICHVLEQITMQEGRKLDEGVNLLGLSIMHNNWQGAVHELKSLLVMLGLFVFSAPGTACSLNDLQLSVGASHNIMVCPEYGARTADWYAAHGIPTFTSVEGAPIGFDATEAWVKGIATMTQSDPTSALSSIRADRERACQLLDRFNLLTGLPKGATFAVKADSSVALPLTKWLYNYLGMVPSSVTVNPGSSEQDSSLLAEFLNSIGLEDVITDCIINSRADIVLADGHTAELIKASRRCQVGIPLSLPGTGSVDFVQKPYFGSKGALQLLDRIVNGMNDLRR